MPVSPERIERLKVIAVSAAREGNSIVFDDPDYVAIRRDLLADAEQKKRLSRFILACTNLREVRQEMQALNSGTAGYKERERFIRESLAELLTEIATVQLRWSSKPGENRVVTSQPHGKSPSYETAAL